MNTKLKEERERFKKANKIQLKDYKYDFLYDQELDRYFEEIDILKEYYEDIEAPIPSYVYGCYPINLHLDMNDIVRNELEDNHYEDAVMDIGVDELDELQIMVNEWCKKQGIRTWYQNEEVVVLLK